MSIKIPEHLPVLTSDEIIDGFRQLGLGSEAERRAMRALKRETPAVLRQPPIQIILESGSNSQTLEDTDGGLETDT